MPHALPTVITTADSSVHITPAPQVSRILEPTVTATLITPDAWVGKLMELCQVGSAGGQGSARQGVACNP